MKFTLTVAMLLCGAIVQFAESQDTFWMPTHGPGVSSDVRSLAVNSSGVVFAGTWNDGTIWKTLDEGGTWAQCGALPDPNPVLAITCNSRDHLFASVYGKGMYRSTDNGTTWAKKDSGLTALSVRTSFVDKIGAVWVATESGLFRSSDNGDSWSLIKPGYFYNVYLDSSAAIAMDDGVSLYRSTDRGTSWISRSISNLGFDGVHPDGSYIASTVTSQIFRSTDFGATWKDLHTGVSWSGDAWSVTFNPRGDIFYARSGSSSGVLASRDTGKTWNVVNGGLTTTFVLPLLYHPKGYLFVGTAGSGVFRTRYPVDPSVTPVIDAQPVSLDFGKVRVGAADTLSLQIFNRGSRDSLRLGSFTSTNGRFTFAMDTAVVPPYGYRTASVVYAPTAFAADTGTIRISTNDPRTPLFFLPVSGQGYELTHAPGIMNLTLVPHYSNQARIVWNRSINDSAGAADPATQYSIWRRPGGTGEQGQTGRPNGVAPILQAASGLVWDFITTTPAIGLDNYAAVVPVPYTYSSPAPWYVFIVAVQTKSMQVYMSPPDSIQDPAPLTGAAGKANNRNPDELVLNQNYPNPFNPLTTITYGLPRKARVSLVVYNSLGQAITTLVNMEQEPGYHQARFDGSNVASGVYFCRLTAGEFVRISKLLLLR